jgi:hypothetical protein
MLTTYYFTLDFSMYILSFATVMVTLSPGLSFIPSLIGLGSAMPTELPHLTRLPSKVTGKMEFLYTAYNTGNLYALQLNQEQQADKE